MDLFSPYDKFKEPCDPERTAAAGFINRALTGKEIRELFPYLSNRLEGNAPLTIFAILELLKRARLDQD